jgi:hypothetical protein
MLELASLYVAVGIGCAVAALRSPPRRLADAALLVALWPLLAPLFLGARSKRPPASAVDVADRVAAAHARLAELDAALARPELDLDRATARRAELEHAGLPRAAVAARLRVRSIETLAGRRRQLAGELEELAELLAQLETQAEIARLAGGGGEPVADLVADIAARVEALEELLAGEAPEPGA